MELLLNHLKDIGPWVLSVIGAVLAKLLHSSIQAIRALEETGVKADLSFEYVAKQDPEYQKRYDTWADHTGRKRLQEKPSS